MAPIGRVWFSQKPLNGYIEVVGRFSIYPVHQWVKLADFEKSGLSNILHYPNFRAEKTDAGPPHPLWLEVDVPDLAGEDWYPAALAKLKRVENLIHLLIYGVESAEHIARWDVWARFSKKSSEGVEISYGIAEGGFATQFEPSLEKFKSDGGTPAKAYQPVEDVDYYDSLMVGNELLYPPSISTAADAYFGLPIKLQKDFDRATFLFHQAEYLRRSRFAPLAIYTSAIECLLDSHGERCDACNQIKYGLSKKFNDFMKEHAPVSKTVESLRKKMYSARSKEAHGEYVPQIDSDAFGVFDANEVFFPWAIRKALVNWLLSRPCLS